ncbi:MAG TPA: cytochrome c [Candidatus Sulfopaludibacter sp.]|nr:cytochrome c [Candidatus Sulfopaludibacter sp.]
MNDPLKSNTPPTPEAAPTVSRSTVPIWIIVLTLMLLFLGMVYFDHHGGWFDSQVYGPYASAEELELYQPKSGAAAILARGKAHYDQVCGLCHGADGLGKPGQAPPLAGSEWVEGIQRFASIPLAGVSGQLPVKGQTWSLSMPAMGAAMSDEDLADVLTYIHASWGNQQGPVTADEVKAIRAKLGAHPQPFSGETLKALPK